VGSGKCGLLAGHAHQPVGRACWRPAGGPALGAACGAAPDATEQQKYEDAKLDTLNLSNVLSLQTTLSGLLQTKNEIKITI
jgi:hypothetical protein